MRRLFTVLGCLLGAGTLTPASAQQLLCQRTFPAVGTTGGLTTRLTGNVTAVNADSALLLVNTSPSGFATGQPRRVALVWVKRGLCDTLPLRTVDVGAGTYYDHSPAYALTTRRKYIRVATTRSTNGTTLQLREFTRRGQLRAQYNYPFTAGPGTVWGALEAPDEGTYLSAEVTGNTQPRAALLKVDVAGQLKWQRTYSSGSTRDFYFNRPGYTVRGNLLLAGSVGSQTGGQAGFGEQYGQVVEVNQQGDSLTSRPILRGRLNTAAMIQEARPLRDGGFLLLTRLDTFTTTTSFSHCAFTRLDANLNEVWTRFYSPAGKSITPTQGEGQVLELADGTLLGVVNRVDVANGTSNRNAEVRLLRFSATGQIIQEYVVPGAVGYAQSLTPLAADSSFILNGSMSAGNTLVQFRIPGLRRVVSTNQTIPAAQPLATRAATAAWPAPAYPNPASTLVTVPLPALSGEARLTLTDLLGRRVRAQGVAAGTSAAVLDVGGLAAGVYLLSLERAGQAAAVQRLTVTGP